MYLVYGAFKGHSGDKQTHCMNPCKEFYVIQTTVTGDGILECMVSNCNTGLTIL